jgi:hypothetical protein
MRRPRPSPRQITEAEEALLWLRWLEKDDARIVWLRANRTPWKKIGRELGLSRPAANRHWQYGIALITSRLNTKLPPATRSLSHVVGGADGGPLRTPPRRRDKSSSPHRTTLAGSSPRSTLPGR